MRLPELIFKLEKGREVLTEWVSLKVISMYAQRLWDTGTAIVFRKTQQSHPD
jgi:hypothetical protein